MSIGDRVSDTFDKLEMKDYEGALHAVCAPLEATAKAEFQTAGQSTYKRFITQNMPLVSNIAFGGREVHNIAVVFDHPQIRKTATGTARLEDIFYHAVRCGLYHESELPANLKFTEEAIFCSKSGQVCLPSSLILGLAVAIIVSPVNAGHTLPKPRILNIGSLALPFEKLWGRRVELLWLLDALKN